MPLDERADQQVPLACLLYIGLNAWLGRHTLQEIGKCVVRLLQTFLAQLLHLLDTETVILWVL